MAAGDVPGVRVLLVRPVAAALAPARVVLAARVLLAEVVSAPAAWVVPVRRAAVWAVDPAAEAASAAWAVVRSMAAAVAAAGKKQWSREPLWAQACSGSLFVFVS